jgi:tetratricopeptide (TPR) repeat protein
MNEDLQRLIGWFLWYLDCSIEELARRAGVNASTVHHWKKGKVTRAHIEKLAETAGLSMAFVDAVVLPNIAALRLGRGAEDEVFRDLGDAARALEGSLAGVGRSAVAELFAFLHEEPPPEREAAREQCARLKSREAEDLWYLIEARPEFHSRELAVLLALESEDVASDDAGRALLLARVAHRIAELVPRAEGRHGGTDEHGRTRTDTEPSSALQGLTLAFVSNAQRVANEMQEAEETFKRALERWWAGEEAERATLPGWRLLDLEASLCRDLRRFSRTLELLDKAQAAAPPEDHPRILVKRAVTLEHMGDAEGAIVVLREAALLPVRQGDRRLPWTIQFNLAANLSLLDRFKEAADLLPRIHELAVSSKELDEIRIVWLRARIDGGLGRSAEARAGFDQVRRDFERREMAYDYALASLERAALDLKEGRTGEVRELAEEMAWIFEAQGIHREALAALTLFRGAAAREEATAEMARRMVRYLYRARWEEGLRFEPSPPAPLPRAGEG